MRKLRERCKSTFHCIIELFQNAKTKIITMDKQSIVETIFECLLLEEAEKDEKHYEEYLSWRFSTVPVERGNKKE